VEDEIFTSSKGARPQDKAVGGHNVLNQRYQEEEMQV
jgi:hypothetical protein